MRAIAIVVFTLMSVACTSDADHADPASAALAVSAAGCGPRLDIGAATVVADGIAVTAAHVVAGADEVRVRDANGVEADATVVAFDPRLDLALLSIAPAVGTSIELSDARVESGQLGSVTVIRPAGDVVRLDAEVLRRADVATTDIYLAERVVRPGFEIRAAIEPGDSGSVVVIDGAATGVVWSRSIERDRRAWVVNIPDDMRSLITADELTPVDVGPCT